MKTNLIIIIEKIVKKIKNQKKIKLDLFFHLIIYLHNFILNFHIAKNRIHFDHYYLLLVLFSYRNPLKNIYTLSYAPNVFALLIQPTIQNKSTKMANRQVFYIFKKKYISMYKNKSNKFFSIN